MISKQVIVIRKDLNMRKGKMCAQAAHASMGALLLRSETASPLRWGVLYEANRYTVIKEDVATMDWLDNSFTKIVVSVDSEEALRAIYARALEVGLRSVLIEDNGKTEFAGVKTPTAVAIGPAWDYQIDPITKDLPLL